MKNLNVRKRNLVVLTLHESFSAFSKTDFSGNVEGNIETSNSSSVLDSILREKKIKQISCDILSVTAEK